MIYVVHVAVMTYLHLLLHCDSFSVLTSVLKYVIFIIFLIFFFFFFFFFFSSRRRHTRWTGDWSSDVCSFRSERLRGNLVAELIGHNVVRRRHQNREPGLTFRHARLAEPETEKAHGQHGDARYDQPERFS